MSLDAKARKILVLYAGGCVWLGILQLDILY
jgi:hypothetical protein